MWLQVGVIVEGRFLSWLCDVRWLAVACSGLQWLAVACACRDNGLVVYSAGSRVVSWYRHFSAGLFANLNRYNNYDLFRQRNINYLHIIL